MSNSKKFTKQVQGELLQHPWLSKKEAKQIVRDHKKKSKKRSSSGGHIQSGLVTGKRGGHYYWDITSKGAKKVYVRKKKK